MTWIIELLHADVVNHNSRGHWNARYQSHREWKTNTAIAAKEAEGMFPNPPVTVTLECVQADRRKRDTDNWMAGTSLKGVLDGLVDSGLLEDDSWRHVREIRCRLTSDPSLDGHRWTLTVTPSALEDEEVRF